MKTYWYVQHMFDGRVIGSDKWMHGEYWRIMDELQRCRKQGQAAWVMQVSIDNEGNQSVARLEI